MLRKKADWLPPAKWQGRSPASTRTRKLPERIPGRHRARRELIGPPPVPETRRRERNRRRPGAQATPLDNVGGLRMSEESLYQLEREVEATRAKLARDLSRLR